MRLIDADSLFDTIKQHEYKLANRFNSIDDGMFTIGIKQAIDEAPTVEAEPVKHGKWTDKHKCSVCGGEAFSEMINVIPQYEYDSDGLIVFSGDYKYDIEYYETDFCPFCGARMNIAEE